MIDTLPPDSGVLNEGVVENEKLPCTTPINIPRLDTPPKSPLKSDTSNQPMIQVNGPKDDPIKQTNLSALNDMPSMPTSNEQLYGVEEVEESHFNIKNWIR